MAADEPVVRVTAFDVDGYLVVPELLGDAQRTTSIEALARVFAAEDDIADDRGWRTDTYRVAYALVAKDPHLLEVCADPSVLAIVRPILGDDAVLAGCNGIDLPPGGAPQRLHRDHPHPTPGTTLFLHVVVALDPFTAETGATRVVPGSHRGELASLGADELDALDGQAVSVDVAAGGAVAFDGALVHAGGANRSDGPRRALHLFYARPWVVPHWDLTATLSPEEVSALTTEQRRVLGVDRPGPRRFDRTERRVVR